MRSHKFVCLLVFVFVAILVNCAHTPELPIDIAEKILFTDRIVKSEPAITTSISDAHMGIPFLDDFNPAGLVPLNGLPRSPEGGFLLRPGLFEFNAQSYCIRAGTYVPGTGDGYLYAPLKGPRAAIIQNILRKSLQHPEIEQRDIQVLLWAIIARTKISDMSRDMQATAAKLLTPKELLELNGGALGLIPKRMIDKAFEKLPPQVRQVREAEARLREMLTEAHASYEELERVALLSGIPSIGKGSRDVPRGRWSYHPDGYFVRYFPSGYSRTKMEIYVPERFHIDRDELGRITRIADEKGNRIETEYNDSVGPVAIPDDPGVRCYAFRSIRFVNHEVIPPEIELDLAAEWKDLGWTLMGTPNDKGRAQVQSGRFYDIQERYGWAGLHKDELNRLDKQFVPQGDVDDVINLGHYAFALKRAIRDEHASEKKWSSGHINMVKKAWQYAVCRREGGEPGAKSFTKSPAGNTAVPGNTALQRLETSDNPADEGDPCQLLSFWIDDEEAILFAYRNEDLIDMVEEYGYSTKLYENAVRNLIREILDAGGLHLFDFNELSQADIEDLFKSQIPEAEGVEIGIGMWTYEDCSIWGYDRHKNGVLVSDAYGNSSDTGRASVIDGFTQLYNGNVRAGTAQYGMSWTHENTHQKQCLKRGDFKDLTPREAQEFEIEAYENEVAAKYKLQKFWGCK